MAPPRSQAPDQARMARVLVLGGALLAALPVAAAPKTSPSGAPQGARTQAADQAPRQQLPAVQLPAVQRADTTPAARDLGSISSQEFDSLPGSTMVRVGTSSMTKEALVRRFQDHQRKTASAPPSMERKQGDFDAARKAALDASNQQVMAQHARVSSAPAAATQGTNSAFNPQPDPPGIGARTALTRKGSNSLNPQPEPPGVSSTQERSLHGITLQAKISKVYGTATDGGLLMIEGSGLGSNPGGLSVQGNFKTPPSLAVQSWTPTSVLARFSLPQGGAMDQTATLHLDTQTHSSASAAVPFKAQQMGMCLSGSEVSVALAPGGVSSSCTYDASASDFIVNRTLPPTGQTYSGTDVFTPIQFANGWTLYYANFDGPQIPPGVRIRAGSPVRIDWTLTTPLCTGELTDNLLDQCQLRYKVYFNVTGPAGLPYK